MAKLSEILKDLSKRLGATIDEELLKQVEDKEVSEEVFAPIFDAQIENFGRNRSKSVHQLYENKIANLSKLREIIGDDKLTKIQQAQGERKLDILETSLEDAINDLKNAKKDSDPNASKDATDRINELQRSLNDLQTKYEGYVSKDDYSKVIKEKDKHIFDEKLLRKFEQSNLADEYKKSDKRLGMKLADFYDIIERDKLAIDFSTGKVIKEDGTDAHRGRQAITIDTLIIEAIGDDKKVGDAVPVQGTRTNTTDSVSDFDKYVDEIYNK